MYGYVCMCVCVCMRVCVFNIVCKHYTLLSPLLLALSFRSSGTSSPPPSRTGGQTTGSQPSTAASTPSAQRT
ncbi:hypothetical protein EON64_09495 [archaeon]|nr:MAG: hypothetical protein EON64_09495 [archaeon]